MADFTYRGVVLRQECGAGVDDSRISYWQSECELYEVSHHNWSDTYVAKFRPFKDHDMYYMASAADPVEALDRAWRQGADDFVVWKEKIFKELGV